MTIFFLICVGNVGGRGIDFPKQLLTQDVRVLTDTYENGARPLADLSPIVGRLSHPVDYQKPSTQFMVQLFNILQKGAPLARAAGRKLNTADFKKADTIRSFTAKGNL